MCGELARVCLLLVGQWEVSSTSRPSLWARGGLSGGDVGRLFEPPLLGVRPQSRVLRGDGYAAWGRDLLAPRASATLVDAMI